MSADLLAAFGFSESIANPNASAITVKKDKAAEDDKSDNYQHNTTFQCEGHHQWILQSQPLPKLSPQAKDEPLWRQDDNGTNVLFDASDRDNESVHVDEEFGEFQAVLEDESGVMALGSQQTTNTDFDLLGLAPTEMESSPQIDLAAHSFSEVDCVDGLENQFTTLGQNQEEPQAVSFGDDQDDWGEFEDVKAEELNRAKSDNANLDPNSTKAPKDNEKTEVADDWDFFENTAAEPNGVDSQQPIRPSSARQVRSKSSSIATEKSTATAAATVTEARSKTQHDEQDCVRPTNIPPPSTLFQLLPQIYSALAQRCRANVPTTSSHLARSILKIYVTTARLIAGRSYRWKRDHHLSQSTRISQAGLKNTGMKLTSLDRSEAIKEDQDTAEAVTAWQLHAATLNAAMLKAKVLRPYRNLAVTLAVKTAAGPGVLTARECCAICGLRRNERVIGIDINTEDTFGEFWVEHWGHTDCHEFWYVHEKMLSRR